MGRALAVLLFISACGGGDDDNDDYGLEIDGAPAPDAAPASYQPGDPITLSDEHPMEDEDPSVLRAADGTMVVAWFGRVQELGSDNADLFLRTTRDGVDWSDLVRVTSDTWQDFAPHLIQTSDGWFHLTWFRRAPAPTYEAWVMHARTMDLHHWDGTERRAADAATIEDWVPTIAERPDGDLQIVFVSRIRSDSGPHDLYTVTSSDGGESWSEVAPLDALNDAAEQDHLPHLARTGADEMTISWNRCDADPATPWSNPTSDLLISTSPDGDSWSQPRAITDDDEEGVLDVFPFLFADHAGDWSLVWVTTALEQNGSVVDLPLAGHPADRGTVPQMTGYSPRIAATPTEGVYLGAWVEGATGEQDVVVRFFAR